MTTSTTAAPATIHETFTRHNPTDDTSLHGAVLASPPKPRAVVGIVHGFGEHSGRYAPVAEMLAERGFAVVGLDLHGHGRTPGPRGHAAKYERLREDVDMLLVEMRERFPGLPYVLWGHSMGGGLVLDWTLDRGALDRGEEGAGRLVGIIATAPLIEAVDVPPRPALSLLRLLGRAAPRLGLDQGISGERLSTLAEERDRYMADPLVHGRVSLALGAAMLDAGKAVGARAASFPLPLLLLHSRDDKLTRFDASERFAQACPACNFTAFDGVEHEIHNDSSRARAVDLITDFIEGLL